MSWQLLTGLASQALHLAALGSVTHFFLVVRTAELASYGFWQFDRTGVVFCNQIAML